MLTLLLLVLHRPTLLLLVPHRPTMLRSERVIGHPTKRSCRPARPKPVFGHQGKSQTPNLSIMTNERRGYTLALGGVPENDCAVIAGRGQQIELFWMEGYTRHRVMMTVQVRI